MKHKKKIIFGAGVDLEKINRFKKHSLKKNNVFLKRIFTKEEIKHCFSKKDISKHLAVRFAAKEAAIKAMDVFGQKNIEYRDIEVLGGGNMAPKMRLRNNRFGKKAFKILLSLAHSENIAIAFVIIYTEQ